MAGLSKVLLTGSNDETSVLLSSALRSEGLNVTICDKNGAEVLKAIEETCPDAVIMDVFLRHIDAVGVLARLNLMDPTKRPLIIVLSDINNKELEKDVLKSGVDYYFLKPFNVHSVAQMVGQLLGWKDVSISSCFETYNNLDVIITEELHRFGIPVYAKGYRYVREAIRLTVENPEMLNYITKVLYPAVAKTFQTTPVNVERAIRNSIQIAWDRGGFEGNKYCFGIAMQKKKVKPKNSEFIAIIADDIRLKRNIS